MNQAEMEHTNFINYFFSSLLGEGLTLISLNSLHLCDIFLSPGATVKVPTLKSISLIIKLTYSFDLVVTRIAAFKLRFNAAIAAILERKTERFVSCDAYTVR